MEKILVFLLEVVLVSVLFIRMINNTLYILNRYFQNIEGFLIALMSFFEWLNFFHSLLYTSLGKIF